MRTVRTLAMACILLIACNASDPKSAIPLKSTLPATPPQEMSTLSQTNHSQTRPVTSEAEANVCSMTPQKYESLHPGVLNITKDVKQPVLVKRVEIDLGRLKKKKLIYGITVLMAVITQDGSVKDPCIIRAYHPEFDKAVIEAVKQWQYEPATKNGKPVAVFFTVTANPEF